jgi:DNA-binding response OmpR family regulator
MTSIVARLRLLEDLERKYEGLPADPRQIFIVSADGVLRRGLRRLFEIGGFCVETSVTSASMVGQLAIRASTRQAPPDAVVIDEGHGTHIHRNRWRGVDVAGWIRGRGWETSVAILGPRGAAGKKIDASGIAGVRVFHKPFDPLQLERFVEQTIA